MANKTAPLLPATEVLLQQLGERLRLSRLRRRLTAKQVAERAGMTVVTLRNLERGNSGVTMGAYLAVMQALGIEQDLALIAQQDAQGRELQDARLPRRVRRSSSQVHQRARAAEEVEASSVAEGPSEAVGQESDWVSEGDFISADELANLIVVAPDAKQGSPTDGIRKKGRWRS